MTQYSFKGEVIAYSERLKLLHSHRCLRTGPPSTCLRRVNWIPHFPRNGWAYWGTPDAAVVTCCWYWTGIQEMFPRV